MSSGPNHRRGHGRIQGNGPRYENPNPEHGCNSTHVAKSRAEWKRLHARRIRRTGSTSYPWGTKETVPMIDEDWGEDT
jgi:hypothetical protein